MKKEEVHMDKRLEKLVEYSMRSGQIDGKLYEEYDVKRGLRDSSGKGVLTGLTEISDVVSFGYVDGEKIPIDGELYFQGVNVQDLVKGFSDRRFAFEEATYLLLFGKLPTKEQLDEFITILGEFRSLPDTFVRDVVMKAPSSNMMNTLQKCVLTLYSYDENPEDISIANVLQQSLKLIAQFPLFCVYGYHAYRHYHLDKSLIIRNPKPELSTAENILRLLRKDGAYTELEAKVLDVALVLHAEHGGGNNSSFTTHVVTSSLTDTYSVIAAAIGSLKGPRHGGANIKVVQMFEEMKREVRDWADEDEVSGYLQKLLNKDAFDHAGLIYGVGHAIYSKSDPRAVIFKTFVEKLSVEKGLEKEFALYSLVERLAPEIISRQRQMYKGVSINVDFYSGFVYNMLGLPMELYTPIFAMARISGWSAHRMEELANNGKIIRPAYKPIYPDQEYVDIENRT